MGCDAVNPKVIFAFVRKNATTILSGMAILGVGITGWLSHRAARKSDPEKKLKEQWKNYIPPVVSGLGTIACIIGANQIHLGIEASMAAAVAFYKAAYDENDIFEKDLFRKSSDEDKEQMVSRVMSNPRPSQTMKIKILEPYTNQWFEATQQEILWAELCANKRMQQRGQVTLNEVLKLYSDPNIKMKKIGNKLGWSFDDECFQEMAGYYYAGGWIDMCPQFDEIDGKRCFVMDYGINPNELPT